MRKLVCILLFAAIALAQNTAYFEASFEISGNVGAAQMQVHVPISATNQIVIQNTNHDLHPDGAGEYIEVSGNFEYSAIVYANNSITKIQSNPAFPLHLTEHLEYMQPDERIDSSSPLISARAAELAADFENELEVIASVIEWAHEYLNYNSSGDLSLVPKASDVLQSRQAACSGYSTLTAALLRSLGIPTKYVEGFIYTGSEFRTHAWLEVYVPGSGWVTADPTNGEFGTIGTALIKIMQGADPMDLTDTVISAQPNPDYEKETSVILLQEKPHIDLFALSSDLSMAEAGFNSYVELTLSIQNLRDEYVTPSIDLHCSSELQVDDAHDLIILPPLGQKTISWAIITPASNSEHIKTYTLQLGGPGISLSKQLRVFSDAPTMSREGISITAVSKSVSDSEITITVSIKNAGNRDAQLTISVGSTQLGSQIQDLYLLANQTKALSFYFSAAPGDYVFLLEVESSETQLAQYISVTVPEKTEDLFSKDVGKILMAIAFIVFIIIALIFMTPLLQRRKKPFEPR